MDVILAIAAFILIIAFCHNKLKESTMFYVIKYYQLNKETKVYELKHMHCDTIKAACEYLQFMDSHPSYVFVSMKKVG